MKWSSLPKADQITSIFLKAVFHKFYFVHYWILCPIYNIVMGSVDVMDKLLGSLCEKCPYTEFFLVRISPYLDWIQENTDQKKLRIWALFTQWILSVNNQREKMKYTSYINYHVCAYYCYLLTAQSTLIKWLIYSFIVNLQSSYWMHQLGLLQKTSWCMCNSQFISNKLPLREQTARKSEQH